MYTYGCRPPKIDLRDYKINTSTQTAIDFPDEFSLQNLPKVKNQNDVNSCVAHATSSILEFYDQNNHNLSTNFIYGIQNKLLSSDHMGMYLQDACKIVKDFGDMRLEDCAGNDEVPICYSIAERAFANKACRDEAYSYRINSYYSCLGENNIKYALMTYGPVLCSIYWRESSYFNPVTHVISFDMKSDGGYHALMIYGWNKDGWLIQNSWGVEFANGGRFVLPYSYGIEEAKCLVDYIPTAGDKALTKPANNKIFNPFYKGANFIINRLKKHVQKD